MTPVYETEYEAMTEQSYPNVKISIDMKRSRIRIHRSTIHALGDPAYIQLLINPSAGFVAFRAVHHNLSGDSIHRVSKKCLLSTHSLEIYSLSLTRTLTNIVPTLTKASLYRMTGKVIPSEGLAVFAFDTLKECSEGEST